MGVYLSIVSGIITGLNKLATMLQQHHDEMNGAAKQTVANQQKVLDEVAKQQSSSGEPIPPSVLSESYRD